MKTHSKNVSVFAAALTTAFAATSVSAQGFEIGGYGQFELYYEDYCCGTYREFEFYGDLTLGYRNGPWYLGAGRSFDYYRYEDSGFSDSFSESNDPYLLIGYENFLLTYGEIQGAGNIFPEDYFGMTDTTSFSDNTWRLDIAMGAFSSVIEHLAVSVDTDDEEISEGLEFGLRLNFNDTIVGVGWEGDSDDLGIIVARDFGNYRVHAVFHDDGDDDRDIGFSAFREFGAFELGAHVEFEPDRSGGEDMIEAFGLAAYYETPVGLLNAQLRRENDGDYTVLEVGLVVPLGDQAPFYDLRMESSENMRRFGY